MPKEELPKKVMLAVFNKPLNETEIGKKIYKKKLQSYPKLMGKNQAIDKCLKRGWIKQVWLDIPEKKKPHGFENMKFYYSDIYPILEEISNELDLIDNEKDILEEILDSDSFRATVGFASDKVDFKKNIDTFEIVKEEIAILSAFALICKNYSDYLINKKFVKYLPKKQRKKDLSRLDKEDIEEIIEKSKKEGLEIDQILDESIEFLHQLIPSRLKLLEKNEIKYSIGLGKDFFSLQIEFCEKLSHLSSYYSDLILVIIGMSFLYPEKANNLFINILEGWIIYLKNICKKHKIIIKKRIKTKLIPFQ